MTGVVFMLVLCAREGLHERELHEMVSLYFRAAHYGRLDEVASCGGGCGGQRLRVDGCVFARSCLPDLSQQKFLSFLQTISGTFLKVCNKHLL